MQKNRLPLGNNCKVAKITSTDSATGKGLASYLISYDNKKPSEIRLYDSINSASVFTSGFTYTKDAIKLATGDYFITDTDGRVIEFHTHANPADISSATYTYQYYYDAAGYLSGKSWYIDARSTAIPAFVYTYTWQSGNLINVTARETTGDKRTALTADLSYDLTLTANNFIYTFPEADELAGYIFTMNFGAKAKNLPSNVAVKTFDESGAVTKTYSTTYSSYQISTDGYVEKVAVKGDSIDGLMLSNGILLFSYTCD